MYLIGMGIIFLFILILALPQIAATCSWYPPFSTSTSPAMALFQAAGLGAIFGGLSVMYWKTLNAPVEDEGGSVDVGPTNSKPPQKMS